ncbi:P27 family phage terminase small subunit [Kitasatospora sp. McL0602]|uniref:P27 family phage terminase small subunit n=1 Tax=Kitasatospora sp. McL0602 TaxID=3439530 RepID=UPI003F8B666B
MNIDHTERDATKVRAALIELYEEDLDLESADLAAIDIAAPMLARAAQLDALVKRDGQMIEGGNRKGMQVLNPAITQAQQNRQQAGNLLAKIRGEGDGPKRGHNSRDALAVRWGNRT